MMDGWKEIKLCHIAQINSGYAFKSKEMTNSSSESIPLVKIKNINERKVYKNFDSYLRNEFTLQKYNKYKLLKGDILVAMTGQGSVGRIGKMHNVDRIIYVNQRVGIVRINEEIADKEFVFQQMANSHNEKVYFNLAMGAGQPNLSPKDIGNLKINLPPLPTQRKIASILSAYDNLIENNLKRIQLLEEKARLTYEEWFVRMKFPGHEVVEWDEVSGLPVGWEKGKINDVAIIGDGAHASIKRTKTGVMYLTSKNFDSNGLKLSKIDYISEKDFEKYFKVESKALTRPQKGDVLLSIIGTMGAQYVVKKDGEFGLSSSVSILRPKIDIINSMFLSYWIKSQYFQKSMQSIRSGVAQSFLSLGMIKSLPCLLPPISILNLFQQLVEPKYQLMINLKDQNQLLKEARDLLLPRLMTGMIDVEALELGELLQKQ